MKETDPPVTDRVTGAVHTEVTATVSRTEMHLRVLREDNGTSGEMTLLGPIRLSATR